MAYRRLTRQQRDPSSRREVDLQLASYTGAPEGVCGLMEEAGFEPARAIGFIDFIFAVHIDLGINRCPDTALKLTSYRRH